MASAKNENAQEQLSFPEPEKRMVIRLNRDFNNPDEEDEVVWVNNTRYIIQRGIEVEVPESVYEILRQRDKNLIEIYNYERKLAAQRASKK